MPIFTELPIPVFSTLIETPCGEATYIELITHFADSPHSKVDPGVEK
jgi:hypothetical protein